MTCPLCVTIDFRFYLTFCDTHMDVPMVVAITHKPEFSEEEKEMLGRAFPGRRIRYEMRSIPDHAHAHIEGW